MKELTIKFLEEYYKMLNNEDGAIPKNAVLMEVFKVNSKDLHPRFIEYDTMYFDKKGNNNAYYKLPKGEVLVLLLKTEFWNHDMVWTTIRRFTPHKYEYYNKNRWQTFKIEILKENPKGDKEELKP